MMGSKHRFFQRRLLAWWLLLLLGRVLAPEATVLHLHAHAHTEEEPAWRSASGQPAKALFTPQHQHCHETQLYQLPFLPAVPILLPAPSERLAYATYQPAAPVCRPTHRLDGTCLRGPPALG